MTIERDLLIWTTPRWRETFLPLVGMTKRGNHVSTKEHWLLENQAGFLEGQARAARKKF